MPHSLIIGAGVIGACIAFQLALRGHEVTVLDAADVGAGATGRSFGWINASFHLNEAHFRLRAEGMAAHRRLSAVLPDCPTRWTGCVTFEVQGTALAALGAGLEALDYRVERLTRGQVAQAVPALGPVPDAALAFPDEGAVGPADLARRLIVASGARLWRGVPVTALATRGGQVTGAVTAEGVIAADHVVVAAGIGAPALVEPLGVALPMLVRPGLMLATRPVAAVLPGVLVTPAGEIRQDAAGRILMPTAAGHQGDAAETVTGLPGEQADAALARLRALFPGLTLDLADVALGWRPVPGDGLPVIGAALPGLWLAVMHSGVTLAAVAGEGLAAEIDGGEKPPLFAPFRPDRFAAK